MNNPTRQLNPFSLPAETNVRFILLLVAALMLAANVGVFVPYLIDSNAQNPFAFQANPVSAPSTEEFFPTFREASQRTAVTALFSLGIPAGLAAMGLVLAAVLYRSYPGWTRRRLGLAATNNGAGDTALQAEVARLAERSGVTLAPKVLLRPSLRTQSAQVFGSGDDPTLLLDRGLQLQLRKAPDIFRAIVLHELGHLLNRDVSRTYFGQALWTATLVVAIVPFTLAVAFILVQSIIMKLLAGTLDLGRVFGLNLPTFLLIVLQVAGALLVVLVTRASLLRVREEYADWRAALDGAGPTLADILERNAHQRAQSLWVRLLQLHPDPRQRLMTLQDATRLFRLRLDLPLLVGILQGFVLTGMLTLVIPSALSLGSAALSLAARSAEAATQSNDSGALVFAFALSLASVPLVILCLLIPLCGAAYLLAGTVGLQVQREAVKDVYAARTGLAAYLGLALPALMVALGMELGFFLAPLGFLSPKDPASASPMLFGQLIFVGITWLLFAYARSYAQRAFGWHVSLRPPNGKRRLLTGVLSGLAGLGLLSYLALRIAAVPGMDPETAQFLQGVATAGFALLGILFGGSVFFTRLATRSASQLQTVACPACGEPQRITGYPVHASCAGCNSPMTPWLFVELRGAANDRPLPEGPSHAKDVDALRKSAGNVA